MDINQMIALAMVRNEIELAELLKDMSDENLALILEFPDYKRSENSCNSVLFA